MQDSPKDAEIAAVHTTFSTCILRRGKEHEYKKLHSIGRSYVRYTCGGLRWWRRRRSSAAAYANAPSVSIRSLGRSICISGRCRRAHEFRIQRDRAIHGRDDAV